MKSIKVLLYGQHLRDIYPHATRWEVFKFKAIRFFRKVGVVMIAVSGLYVSYAVGAVISTPNVNQITIVSSGSPVLDRIRECEGGTQFDPKTGQVRVMWNTNRTEDIGAYAINLQVWGKTATELGYDIFSEQGNEDMARWIYANKGTGDWSASYKCWHK
jgi:hypothetical protein